MIIATGEVRKGLPRKEEKLTYPTKEQLELWRSQEKSNVEIANMTGRSIGTINGLFSKYKIAQRRRAIPQDKIDTICRMKEAGSSAKEIADKTGCGLSTVQSYIKAAGLVLDKNRKVEPDPEPEFPAIFAIPKEPKIEKVVIDGRRYIDITDLYLPG